MEVRTEMRVVAYLEEMQCHVCGYGKMISDGIALMSHPPKYQHTCNSCQWQDSYLKSYPNTHVDTVPFEVEE